VRQQQDTRTAWTKYQETPRDEVERLLREHKQNQDLVRRLGNRYYQVVYPIQVRHREKISLSTREIDRYAAGSQGSGIARGVNDLDSPLSGPRHQKHYRQTSLLIKAFQHKFRLDLELNTRLIAPNVQKKVFLANGATATSTSASQDVEQCYYHGVVKDWQGGEFIPGSMAALQTCNGVSGIIHLGNETFVIHPFYGGDLSSKHPHIIYESNEKPRQLCGVPETLLQMRSKTFNRNKREMGDNTDRKEGEESHIFNNYKKKSDIDDLINKMNKPTIQRREGDDILNTLHGINRREGDRFGNSSRKRRDVRYVSKFIETALVLDKAMFDNRQGLSRRDVIHESIQVANIADLYFKESLKTRLSIVYIETWQDQDQAPGINKQQEISKAMEDFNSYVSRNLFEIEKDTTQLFTGRNSFKNFETTMATVGRICTERSVGINVDVNPFEPHILASNLAHAIGHNLGFGHDSNTPKPQSYKVEPCQCADWHGCIMSPGVSGTDGIQPYKFSTCSLKTFQKTMEQGSALCLLNRPSELGQFGTCGNGVIDDGEDCDCGSEADCASNPCCSPITCRLRMDAECSTGPCCDNCRMKPKGSLCRHAMGECDLDEYCTGEIGECSADLYVKNGGTCQDAMGNPGFCFNGECPTHAKQCRVLWGNGAEPAERECFNHYNMQGTNMGNCGENKYKYGGSEAEFKKCQLSEVMCGTLHCQGGLDKPIVSEGSESHIIMQTSFHQRDVECKLMMKGGDSSSSADLGLVRDGSKCGNNRICLNQTCKDLGETRAYTKCPQSMSTTGEGMMECSGNGKCSNINTCVCDIGWGGLDCGTRMQVMTTRPTPTGGGERNTPAGATHPDEGPTKSHTHVLKESDSDTIIMVIVLVVGVGCIFLLFAIMALCYRRKSALPKYDPPYIKRPMALPKGYSHPNSPHPSQHMTPDHPLGHPNYPPGPPIDHQGQDKMMNYTPTPAYRSVEEHGMKRMNHGGSMGSQHQLSGSQGLGSGQNLMTDSYQQDKGILKKPGGQGYCGLDKDRWEPERLSSSSQNNLVSLSGGQTDRPDSRRTDISDVERTLKSLNGYHEDILEALRDAASNRSGGGPGPPVGPSGHPVHPAYSGMESAGPLAEELKRHLVGEGGGYRSERGRDTVRGQQSVQDKMEQVAQDQDEMGPIRIRNLEDLIRQLEHSSNRHMSPSGSEDVRCSETEADRHFRSPGVHCTVSSGSDRYFSSSHHLPLHHNTSAHERQIEDGSESDSIESIYKKLSTPKRSDSRSGSRGSSFRGGRPLPSPHEFQ